MNTDNLTTVIMGHIRANKLDGDYIVGGIIFGRFLKEWQNLSPEEKSLETAHRLAENVINHYLFEDAFEIG